MTDKTDTEKRLTEIINSFKQKRPLLLVISGPSGVGKDAVINGLKRHHDIYTVITTTTRTKRPRESQGNPYHFVSKLQFEKIIASDKLLEWAKVYDNYYGVPRNEVVKALKKSQAVVIKVDVQGARTIKSIIPEAIYIFLLPSKADELSRRIIKRGSTGKVDLQLRLKTAEEEINYISLFDYVVLNAENRLDQTISSINSIIKSERCRVQPRNISL
jgi:guanylate kinase